MTCYDTSLKFKATETDSSCYCASCGIIVPLKKMSVDLDIDLEDDIDSNQVKVSMPSVFSHTSVDTEDSVFMGIKCPICNRPMALVDSGVVNIVYGLNRMKLFTIFSCEGHCIPKIDINTTLTVYRDCSVPYVSLIGNGRVLKDIILFNLLEEGIRFTEITEGNWTVDYRDQDRKDWIEQLAMIKYDVPFNSIYSTISCCDKDSAKYAVESFANAMSTLLILLRDGWIRNWYDNCKDDGEYFFDTEKKKAEYREAWENDLSPEVPIKEYFEGGMTLNECE